MHSVMSMSICMASIVITTYISPSASLTSSVRPFAMPSPNSPNSSTNFSICLFGSAVCRLRSTAHCFIKSVVLSIPKCVIYISSYNHPSFQQIPLPPYNRSYISILQASSLQVHRFSIVAPYPQCDDRLSLRWCRSSAINPFFNVNHHKRTQEYQQYVQQHGGGSE